MKRTMVISGIGLAFIVGIMVVGSVSAATPNVGKAQNFSHMKSSDEVKTNDRAALEEVRVGRASDLARQIRAVDIAGQVRGIDEIRSGRILDVDRMRQLDIGRSMDGGPFANSRVSDHSMEVIFDR
ncbi:hypothetical protein J2Z48_000780 [Croceifilum oryzae]|uniref:Uncharacterized protein n=1 Tax=Croceifilum oryzae TaxID=1553429 RepID=A0AAJ1TD44_9BACL|nr:hypothetical protein [Croceifilum oryzae]MDQ0416613.1 hypothetical protein [Croceifilum oryzae]